MNHARHTTSAFAGRLAVAAVFVLANVVAPTPAAPPAEAPEATSRVTDRLGDPLPPGALARFGTVRLRHGDSVYGVAFSPDGKLLASTGMDAAVRFWDVATGKPEAVLRGPANCLAFAPDGKTLAAGAAWGTDPLCLWDVATGKRLRRFGTGPHARVHAVAFSPDGKLLASGGEGNPVRLWDPATGKEKAVLGKDDDSIKALAFSPDGQVLAAIRNLKVCLWDVATGTELRSFGVESETFLCLAIAPDGRTLATGSDKEMVRLWDLTAGKEIRRLPLESPVQAVAFSPDGKRFASAAQNETVHLWDVQTGKEVRSWPGDPMWVDTLAFAPDGRTLATGGHGHAVRLWDTRTGKELHPALPGHRAGIHSVALLPNGQVATGGDDGVRVWRTDSAEEVRTLPHGDFSPDRKFFLAPVRGKGVRLLDALTGKELRRFEAKGDFVNFALAPDGRTLALGEWRDGTVRLVQVETGKDLHRFAGDKEKGNDWLDLVTFAPDGKTLLARRSHSGLWLWDVESGKAITSFEAGPDALETTIPFTADGKRFALLRYNWPSVQDHTLSVHQTQNGRERHRWQWTEEPTYARSTAALALSPDGEIVTALGGAKGEVVRLLSVSRGTELRRLRGHQDIVWLVVFSPDGRTLVTTGLDGTIRLWETATGKERLRLAGHEGNIVTVAQTADSRTLISVSGDTTALVWDLTGLAATAGQLPRLRLTPGEEEALWALLADPDAGKAFRALWKFAAAEQGTKLLREHLRPVAPFDARKLARLLADLDSPKFEIRDKAKRELEETGEGVVPGLRKVLSESPSPEVRKRVEELLDTITNRSPQGEILRALRAVEALERIGNAEARGLLRELANGAAEATLTREALSSLRRLEKATP
jgi:WD40 repeat protein